MNNFIVAGTNHYTKAIEDVAVETFTWDLTAAEKREEYSDGDRLFKYESDLGEAKLIPEPENEYDPNAIRVEIKGQKVGYIKKGSTSEVKNLMKEEPYVRAELFGGPYIDFEEDEDGKLRMEKGSYDYKITLHIGATQPEVTTYDAAPAEPQPDPKAEKKAAATQRWLLILAIICTIGAIVMSGAWRIIYIVAALASWLGWFKKKRDGAKK